MVKTLDDWAAEMGLTDATSVVNKERAERDRRAEQRHAQRLATNRWRAKNRAAVNRAQREYRKRIAAETPNIEVVKTNHIRTLLSAAKTRRPEDFNITLEDLQPLPDNCPVLGVPIRYGVRGAKDYGPSLDRIDNSKGYIKGNVKVISGRANRLKSDMTLAELDLLRAYMTQQLD